MEQVKKDFKEYLEKISLLDEILSTINFDNEIYAPEGGVLTRSKRISYLEVEIFSMKVSEKMKYFLDELGKELDNLDTITKAMVRNAKREYDKNTKIPKELVKEMSEAKTKAFIAWDKARKENNFKEFAPHLKSLIDLQKKMISYRAINGENAYEILLDDYEKGMDIQTYDKLFTEYKEIAVPLLKKIQEKKQIDSSYINEEVPIEMQEKISEFIAAKLGYKLNNGLIAVAAHPFCNPIDKYDVRITTRYDEKDFLSSLYSVAHETGHALYEQNIGDELLGTGLEGGVSMGIHESQSRFYENMIGRSEEFWDYIAEELKTYLPEKFKNLSPDKFFKAANKALASFIRVEADELTYSIHILIRYEIEKMIFTEEVNIEDLPKVWNKKYEEYLGITPPTDSVGVLQDIHWSYAYFGYFPTYFLGSAYAAQFFAKKENAKELIREGKFDEITKWLEENIHRHGMVYDPNDLVQNFIGEPLNVKYYTDYLTEKFTKIYNL